MSAIRLPFTKNLGLGRLPASSSWLDTTRHTLKSCCVTFASVPPARRSSSAGQTKASWIVEMAPREASVYEKGLHLTASESWKPGPVLYQDDGGCGAVAHGA